MSYAVEWIWGPVVSGMVLLFLIVPEFAVIAVVIATIVVFLVAVAALVALVALAAAALASPYLLVRSVRRRRSRTKNMMDPLAERDRGADRPPDRLRVLGRGRVTAFAHDEPGEAGAMLEGATRGAA
jgi:membrane protein implicated in regulation of membrane protease activity